MSTHEGHRARLKERFLREGLDSFSTHEVVELMLFYAIPQRDVNETGKEIVHALTLEKSVEETRENRDFLADIKKTKQDELKLNFENKVLEEERKKLEAKQNKAEAFYKSFRPILEFDFSSRTTSAYFS